MGDRQVRLLGMGALSPAPGEKPPLPPGMNARKARRLCRQSRLALYAADLAWRQAGLDGQNGELYVGLTHGSTSFLQDFHDYLFDHGPEAASPNAFAGGVAGAPLATISAHLGLTLGGSTLVGYEACGLEVLNLAARRVIRGETPACLAGACEERSDLVRDVYTARGWYPGAPPPHLPFPRESKGPPAGLAMAEGSAFFALGPETPGPGIRYQPVDDPRAVREPLDMVISGAGGGPQDPHELDLLEAVLTGQDQQPLVRFSKPALGETFAVGGLLSVQLACQHLQGLGTPKPYPLHPRLLPLSRAEPPSQHVRRVLVMAADRAGAVHAGLALFDRAAL